MIDAKRMRREPHFGVPLSAQRVGRVIAVAVATLAGRRRPHVLHACTRQGVSVAKRLWKERLSSSSGVDLGRCVSRQLTLQSMPAALRQATYRRFAERSDSAAARKRAYSSSVE